MVLAKQVKVFALLFVFGQLMAATLQFWEGNVQEQIMGMNEGTINPYREFNNWVNGLFFHYTGLSTMAKIVESYVLALWGDEVSYYLLCYMRDLVAGTMVYWFFGSAWHLIVYNLLGDKLFTSKGRPLPSKKVIQTQMIQAQSALFIYAMLPVLSEFLIERGLTKTYFFVDQIGGWPQYAGFLLMYICAVEVGIYWMHRVLHTNKWLYNNIHGPHHLYKTKEMLTPWSSIAFHPIDGIMQACPYVIMLFFVPVHYFTHIFLLFFSGVWATNIHDATWADTEPIMGSKYHTVHHTHYMYNYGQFFIFCDWFWGTLRVPVRSKED